MVPALRAAPTQPQAPNPPRPSQALEPTHVFLLNCGRCLKSAADARELFPCLQTLRPDAPGDTPNHTVLFQAMLYEGQAAVLPNPPKPYVILEHGAHGSLA